MEQGRLLTFSVQALRPIARQRIRCVLGWAIGMRLRNSNPIIAFHRDEGQPADSSSTQGTGEAGRAAVRCSADQLPLVPVLLRLQLLDVLPQFQLGSCSLPERTGYKAGQSMPIPSCLDAS